MDILHITDDSLLTITRQRTGRGFCYHNGECKVIAKPTLKRIKSLVVPPMWEEVKISSNDRSHIQAVGRDNKSRLQYIYHELWSQQRQQDKFKALYPFGINLPKLREQCIKQLKSKSWNREKVLALMVLILDDTGIRIGNRSYTQRNHTYGLSTLRRKHVNFNNNSIVLNFTGKGSKSREVELDDPILTDYIREVVDQPGYELFRYKDTSGAWKEIDSQDVNEFVQSILGDEFSSKYFRTWVATRLAVELYPEALRIKEENSKRSLTKITCRLVADELGHTPTTCRKYYIHPNILGQIENRSIPSLESLDDNNLDPALSPIEEYVLKSIMDR